MAVKAYAVLARAVAEGIERKVWDQLQDHLYVPVQSSKGGAAMTYSWGRVAYPNRIGFPAPW